MRYRKNVGGWERAGAVADEDGHYMFALAL